MKTTLKIDVEELKKSMLQRRPIDAWEADQIK